MNKSITLRVYMYFALVLTLVVILTGVIFMNLYQTNYIRSYTALLTKQGKKIAERVRDFRMEGDINGYENYSFHIDEIEEAEKTDVWIISNDEVKGSLGEEYSNARIDDETINKEMNDVVKKAMKGKIASSSSYDKAYGMVTLRVAVPVLNTSDDVIGVVMMISMISRQTMGIREGRSLITISALMAVVVTYIISILFARQLSKPIRHITMGISKMARGDYARNRNDGRSRQLSTIEEELDSLAEKLNDIEEERKRLEQGRKDFFANISHELRTPITVIRGYMETLNDGIVTEKSQVDSMYDRVIRECMGLERLVNDLFDLSKMGNPDFKIDKEPFSLTQLLTDIVKNGNVMGHEKNISLRLETDCTNQHIMIGDYSRIYQMIMIIVDNAIKFSYEGGEVIISLTQSSESYIVGIKDFGVGIDESKLPYVFEKFYKSKMRQNEKGTGLGLMIAKEIAKRHDGNIYVDSEPGKGSKFTFTLPVPDEEVIRSIITE